MRPRAGRPKGIASFGLLLSALLVALSPSSTLAQPLTNAGVFQFNVFYNGLLELTWAAPTTFSGRIHANGNMYVGTAWSNVFGSTVSLQGNIQSPAWDGHITNEYTVPPQFKGIPPYITNFPPYTIAGLTNTPAALHAIIEIPPPGRIHSLPSGNNATLTKPLCSCWSVIRSSA